MGRGGQTTANRTSKSPSRNRIVPIGARRLLPSPEELAQSLAFVDAKTKVSTTLRKAQTVGEGVFRQIYAEGDFVLEGNKIGEWARWIRQERLPAGTDPEGYPTVTVDSEEIPIRLIAKSSWLQIDEKHRKQGIGSRFVDHTEKVYRQLGVHQVDVWATHVGSYAWAKNPDYRLQVNSYFDGDIIDFNEAEAASLILRIDSQDKIDAMLEQGNITPEQLKTYESRFLPELPPVWPETAEQQAMLESKPVQTPYEILQVGRDNMWETERGVTWFGKELLLERPDGWEGYRILK